jgi:hypothetical protein
MPDDPASAALCHPIPFLRQYMVCMGYLHILLDGLGRYSFGVTWVITYKQTVMV